MDHKFILVAPYQAGATVLRLKATKSEVERKHQKVASFVACPVEGCLEVFKHVTALVYHRPMHCSIEEQETLHKMHHNPESRLKIKCYYCHREYTNVGLYFKHIAYHARKISSSGVWPFQDVII